MTTLNITKLLFIALIYSPIFGFSQVLTNNTSISITKTWTSQPSGYTYPINDNLGKTLLVGKIKSENTSIDIKILSKGIYYLGIGGYLKNEMKIVVKPIQISQLLKSNIKINS